MIKSQVRPYPVGSTSDFLPTSYLTKQQVETFVNRFLELNSRVEENGDRYVTNLHYPRSKKWRLDRGSNF